MGFEPTLRVSANRCLQVFPIATCRLTWLGHPGAFKLLSCLLFNINHFGGNRLEDVLRYFRQSSERAASAREVDAFPARRLLAPISIP